MPGGGAPVSTLASPRLARMAARRDPAAGADPGGERCEMCGAALASEHRHLVDIRTRELVCACRPCSLLFDRRAAAEGHLRLVGDRRRALDDFILSDATWDALRIPVDVAFLFDSSAAGRVLAFYPGPMGATESLLELAVWRDLADANPVLRGMEPDVEALLVKRTGPPAARRAWLVPIDDPYRLVALIRTRWRGFSGGREVWAEIDGFFENLDRLTAKEAAHARQ